MVAVAEEEQIAAECCKPILHCGFAVLHLPVNHVWVGNIQRHIRQSSTVKFPIRRSYTITLIHHPIRVTDPICLRRPPQQGSRPSLERVFSFARLEGLRSAVVI